MPARNVSWAIRAILQRNSLDGGKALRHTKGCWDVQKMSTLLETKRRSTHPVTSLKRGWTGIFCRPMYRVCAGGHGFSEGES